MPVEPAPTDVVFPPATTADVRGRVSVGGDLAPGTLLAAYRSGLFPMRQSTGEMTWWSPDPRAILTPAALHVSHSLRRSLRQFEIRADTVFDEVVAACADRPADEYLWITDEIRDAYGTLHRLGWAHSVETWATPVNGGPAELVGGLYGIAIGGFFGGESMFHRRADASKAALVALVEILQDDGHDGDGRIIDAQWMTPHLASLGAVEVSRDDYLARLARALELPLPTAFARGDR